MPGCNICPDILESLESCACVLGPALCQLWPAHTAESPANAGQRRQRSLYRVLQLPVCWCVLVHDWGSSHVALVGTRRMLKQSIS